MLAHFENVVVHAILWISIKWRFQARRPIAGQIFFKLFSCLVLAILSFDYL